MGFSGLNDATMPFLAFHRCGKHCNCSLRIFFYVTVVNNPLYNSNLLLAFTFNQTLYFTSCSIYPCLPKLVTNIFSSCGMITLSSWISCRCGHVCPRPVWDENTAGVGKGGDVRVKKPALKLKIASWDGTAMKFQQTIIKLLSLLALSDFVFLCLCLLTHIWSVLFPIIS